MYEKFKLIIQWKDGAYEVFCTHKTFDGVLYAKGKTIEDAMKHIGLMLDARHTNSSDLH